MRLAADSARGQGLMGPLHVYPHPPVGTACHNESRRTPPVGRPTGPPRRMGLDVTENGAEHRTTVLSQHTSPAAHTCLVSRFRLRRPNPGRAPLLKAIAAGIFSLFSPDSSRGSKGRVKGTLVLPDCYSLCHLNGSLLASDRLR